MTDTIEGCAPPAGRVGPPKDHRAEETQTQTAMQSEEQQMEKARVGKKAPDFEMPAYHKGQFTTVKLSDYAGKWFLLCFYPGDFTFV